MNPMLLVLEKEIWFRLAVRIPSAKTAQAAQKQTRRIQTQRRAAAEPSEGGGGGGTLQFILVLHRAGLYRIWRSGGRFFSGGSGSGEGAGGFGRGGVFAWEDGGEGDAENPEDSGEEGG